MDWWSLAPYWVPGIIAVVVVVVIAAAARSRATKRSAREHRTPSVPEDWSYLDSSHIGEPQSRLRSGHARTFRSRAASGRKRH